VRKAGSGAIGYQEAPRKREGSAPNNRRNGHGHAERYQGKAEKHGAGCLAPASLHDFVVHVCPMIMLHGNTSARPDVSAKNCRRGRRRALPAFSGRLANKNAVIQAGFPAGAGRMTDSGIVAKNISRQ
jgi:hypothetical protein